MAKIGLWIYHNDGGDVIESKLTSRLVGAGHDVVGDLDMRSFHLRNGRVHDADDTDLSALDVFYHMNADQQDANQFDQLFALERSGVTVINRAQAYADARDKPVANQILRRAGLRVPDAVLATPPELARRAQAIVAAWGAVVLKPRDRHGGAGIMRIDDAAHLRDVVEALPPASSLYCEQFIPFGDTDQRVEVIAGKAIGGYSRRRTHPFKTNVSAGGLMLGNPPSEEMKALALAAAAAIGLDHTIVDLLRRQDDGKLFVVEVNPIMGIFVEHAMRVSPKTRVRAIDPSYAFDDLKLDLLCAHIDTVARRRTAEGRDVGATTGNFS